MGLGRTFAVALLGVEGHLVEVEAHGNSGLVAYHVGGLPDAACRQSPDRVRAAATSIGEQLSPQRWTINLSPASLPKAGSAFDLAIAMALLAADGKVPPEPVSRLVHIGELGLDGTVRPVEGVLPMVLAAVAAGRDRVVVASANATEAALVPGVQVYGVSTLQQLVELHEQASAGATIAPFIPRARPPDEPCGPDMRDIVGQLEAREALEVAAAGRHHMLLVGPPGAGKTMLAERLPGLLPELTRADALEVTGVHSVLGLLPAGENLVARPPFVAPHHSASMASIIGGGSGRVRPGAVSRAHRGVLFLDETPEFRRDVLDGLREPLESGEVHLARAERHLRLPARFQLVAAANPCPCGRGTGKGRHCRCTPLARAGYLAKLSGPLLDRIDLQIQVLPVSRFALGGPAGESTADVAARVREARQRQATRWKGTPWRVNADVRGADLRRGSLRLAGTVTEPLDAQMDLGALTLRGYDRCLRLAWTLADLEGAPRPERSHVSSALTLRTGVEVGA